MILLGSIGSIGSRTLKTVAQYTHNTLLIVSGEESLSDGA